MSIANNPYLASNASSVFFRDWQHAARLYVDDAYRLAPKPKWMHYAVFNINETAVSSTAFREQNQRELNYLVKKMDLPRYTLDIERLNQYNRKTTSYTKIVYEPVNISLHDDNNGVTNALWALYYGYYFADRLNASTPYTDVNPAAYQPHTYDVKSRWPYRYGLDNGITNPFFQSIQLINLTKHKFTSYLLCNPKITSWQHDTMDQSEGNGIVENNMTVIYDAVIYTTGSVSYDQPSGFSVLHYDNMISPLNNESRALIQGSATPNSFNLYSENSFNPIDTAISQLANVRQSGFYGNLAPYGFQDNVLNSSFYGPYTTSGLSNYSFGSSVTNSGTVTSNSIRSLTGAQGITDLGSNTFNSLPNNTDISTFNNTNFNSGVRYIDSVPVDQFYNTGESARRQAITNEFTTGLRGANIRQPPIVSDAYTGSLPRTLPESRESKIFQSADNGQVLPETVSSVNMGYFTIDDIQNNQILVNELINFNPQSPDIPDDPFL